MISPTFDLSSVSMGDEMRLCFWQWFSFDGCNDAGYVQVSVWEEEAWSAWANVGSPISDSSPWSRRCVELTEYAGDKLRVAFYHTASTSYPCGNSGLGWFIDDIEIVGVTLDPVISCPSSPVAAEVCALPDEVCIDFSIINAETVIVEGATWSENHLCFTADVPGTYDFTVIATNSVGSDTCEVEVDVELVDEPEACFTALPENGFAPLTVSFSNCSTPESGLTYAWDFGDSTTSTEKDPMHTYTDHGYYTARLIAESSCGADTASFTIVVDEPTTVASLFFYPDSACLQPDSIGVPTTIELKLSSPEPVMAVSSEIHFDHTLVNVNSLEAGSFMSSNSGSVFNTSGYDNATGVITVIQGVAGGDPPGVAGTGTLLLIEFIAVAGDPTSELHFVETTVRDTMDQNIPTETEDGSIMLADNLLGDFDHDGDVDFRDFTYFIWCWNRFPECTDSDLASLIVGPPPPPPPWTVSSYPYGPDGTVNIDDLMVFILMYNWSGRFEATQASDQMGPAPFALGATSRSELYAPSAIALHDRFAIGLEVADAAAIIGYRFELSFDREVLTFQGTNLEVLLHQEGNHVGNLDRETECGIEVCRAVLGELPARGSGPLQVEFYFEGIKETAGTSVAVDEIDLRTAKNQTILQPVPTARELTVTGEATGLPTQLALRRNVPNPFMGQTLISFDLPRATRMDLTVYDIAGRRVKQLMSGAAEAGSHELIWDGRDDQGAPAASGVYFYNLTTESGRLQKRMLLTR